MLGDPSGAWGRVYGPQSGFESRTSSLMTPLNGFLGMMRFLMVLWMDSVEYSGDHAILWDVRRVRFDDIRRVSHEGCPKWEAVDGQSCKQGGPTAGSPEGGASRTFGQPLSPIGLGTSGASMRPGTRGRGECLSAWLSYIWLLTP